MTFFNRFSALCRENGKSPNAVASEIGVSSGSVTVWKQNGTMPRTETLKKVAEYFNVSIESLLADDEKNPPPEGNGHITLSEEQKEALSLMAQMTDQEISLVLSQLRGIVRDRQDPGVQSK